MQFKWMFTCLMTFIHSGSNLPQFSLVDRYILLFYYRHKCFTGKYTTCKIHSGVFSIFSLVRILVTSFFTFSHLFVQTISKTLVFI